MSQSQSHPQRQPQPLLSSIDAVLNRAGKKLKPGETITFTLVKGPTSSSADPILAAVPQTTTNKVLKDNGLSMTFPQIAKFGDSVKKPDFDDVLRHPKMYEENIPKAKDDSDEEEDRTSEVDVPLRRKKRRRRKDAPRRHWVIDPNSARPSADASNRYEGVPESNTSHYALFSLQDNPSHDESNPNNSNSNNQLKICVQPVHGFHSFSQPKRTATLTLSEAEKAITNQRQNITRYTMHNKLGNKTPGAESDTPKAKSRLLCKLVNIADDDDDDVMADLSYRERTSGARARKELLSDLGDGLTVDDDGVLGGANDTEFGGAKRFGHLKVSKEDDSEDNPNKKKGSQSNNTSRSASGNEAMAIDDDFYQRDVAAEYDELDFDAKDQFDDDDVDVGQDEIQLNDQGGFAGEVDDDINDDDFIEESSGGTGLASASGFKNMMAKARGEQIDEPGSANQNGTNIVDENGKKKTAYNRTDESLGIVATKGNEKVNTIGGGLDQVIAAASSAVEALKKKAANKQNANSSADDKNPNAGAPKTKYTGVEIDENGFRLITLEAIRREIWLHHGQIQMRRLIKIFGLKKNKVTQNVQRKNKFMEIVKELCIMKVDKVEGKLLVLKQHYSNMG